MWPLVLAMRGAHWLVLRPVRPRGDVIEISAVTEHPAVHTADA